MTLFIADDRLSLEMKLKKLVLILIGCFTLVSCASFDPKWGPTGYKSINEIPVKDKNSSKIYLIHQYYEFPGFPIRARIYVDDKYIGRTLPELIKLHESNKSKTTVEIYGEYCAEDEFKKYGSAKINLDLKPGDEHYLVIREKYTAFEAAVGGNVISWAVAYAFCKNVESNKTAFHEIRKVSKDAWTEISKTKSKAVAGAYEYKDEELKAARIEQLK
jgi:hypothetical protein